MFVAGNWSEGGGTPASVEHDKGLSIVQSILAHAPKFVKGRGLAKEVFSLYFRAKSAIWAKTSGCFAPISERTLRLSATPFCLSAPMSTL